MSKQLTNNFDLGVMLSSNSISKWGQIVYIDVSLNVDDQQYLGIDLMSNYFLMSVNSIKPFISNGFGYTWIQEGTYNTIVTKGGTDNLVGAMTVNIGAGLKFDVNDFFSISLQSTYKHSFEDYLTKYWLHAFGIKYNILSDCLCNYK